MDRHSGTMRGRRTARGGRSAVGKSPQMATLFAPRSNPAIKGFCGRLVEAGKPTKVALMACTRKLLTILGPVLRNRTQLRRAWPQARA